MTIAAILKGKGDEVITLSVDATVAQAVSLFAQHRIGAAPVMSGDEIAGMFSERDVIHFLANSAAVLQRRVSELMTAPAVTVTQGDSVIGALALMTQRRIRHLPVVDAGRLIGLVSIGDLVKFRIERIEAEADALRTYVQSA